MMNIASSVAQVLSRVYGGHLAVTLFSSDRTMSEDGVAKLRLPSSLVRRDLVVTLPVGSATCTEEEQDYPLSPEGLFAQFMPPNLGAVLGSMAVATMVAWPGFPDVTTETKAQQFLFAVVIHLMGVATIQLAEDFSYWELTNIVETFGDPPQPIRSVLVAAAALDPTAQVIGTGMETVIRITPPA